MMRADLLVGPKTDTGKRMSFKEKEKEKKNLPTWNDERNDITVGMATAGPS